jgi:hypothetical protein
MKRVFSRFAVAMGSSVLLMLCVSSPALASAPPGPPRGHIVITIESVKVGPDRPVPVEGSAVANAIAYDSNLWAVVWKCSYAGWESGLSVSWSCKLRDFWTNQILSTKTGSFSNGSANPGPWYYFAANSGYCVDAEAHYGGWSWVGDSSSRCNVA